MGWLQRLFGMEKPENAQVNPEPAPSADTGTGATGTETIPPERLGLNGEYDQSGLAKRVALAFDEEPSLEDLKDLYVAQSSGIVVLKGEVPSQEHLNKVVEIARGVTGATDVQTDQVSITG